MNKLPKEILKFSRKDGCDVIKVGNKIYYDSTIIKMWLKVPQDVRKKIYDETEPDWDISKDG